MEKRKKINIALAVLYVLFAIVQLNDPDPIEWFLLYFFVAVFCVVANFVVLPKKLLLGLIVAYLLYSGYYFSYFMDWIQIEHKEELFGKMVYEKPYLGGTREFLGLLIAAAGLFYLYVKVPSENKQSIDVFCNKVTGGKTTL